MDISGYLIQLAEIFHHQLLVYFLGAFSGIGLETDEYIDAPAFQLISCHLSYIQLLVFRKKRAFFPLRDLISTLSFPDSSIVSALPYPVIDFIISARFKIPFPGTKLQFSF